MNYESAWELLNSRTTWKNKAHLANKTLLLRDAKEAEQGDDFIVTLFNKEILRFQPNGVMEVQDHGFFSTTTLDRLNRFLPSGFRVWGETVPRIGLLGFLRTPYGVAPWNPPMCVTEDGRAVWSKTSMVGTGSRDKSGHLDVHEVAWRLPKYITKYLRKLYRGELVRPSEDDSCYVCLRRYQLVDTTTATVYHIAEHILQDTYPSYFVHQACADWKSERNMRVELAYDPTELVRLLWRDGYVRRRKPRTRAEEADKMEALLKYRHESPIAIPDIDLRRAGWNNLREVLTEYLRTELDFSEVKWNKR